MQVYLKRAYEPAGRGDGMRVLVDRLWPRGLSKQEARIDLWLKDVAPSNDLRKWFGHDPEKWQEFERRYFAELQKEREAVAQLKRLAQDKHVTLIYSARDEQHNQAVALKEFLEQESASG
jgi:uncharacterized protein YeaO (DUF488 family)